MAVNGTISIFRLTTGGSATETSVTDKVEFNGDAVQPDAKSFIQHVKPVMSIVGQENPNPDSDFPNTLDETGLAFVGLEITGYFKDTTGTRPLGIARLRDWMGEPKKNSTYPFGRFGFRDNIGGEFDIVPTSVKGYILEHFECDDDYTVTNGRTTFTIKLRYQGDPTVLGD